MSAVRYWIVFSLGVAVGATVALIYAPQSGERTRRQLKRNFEDASDYIRDTTDDLTKQAKRVYKNTKPIVEDAASKVTSVAGKVADRVGDLV